MLDPERQLALGRASVHMASVFPIVLSILLDLKGEWTGLSIDFR